MKTKYACYQRELVIWHQMPKSFFLVFLSSIVAMVVRSVGRNLLSTGSFECEIDYTRSDQPIPRVLTSPIDAFLPKRFGRVSRRGVLVKAYLQQTITRLQPRPSMSVP